MCGGHEEESLSNCGVILDIWLIFWFLVGRSESNCCKWRSERSGRSQEGRASGEAEQGGVSIQWWSRYLCHCSVASVRVFIKFILALFSTGILQYHLILSAYDRSWKLDVGEKIKFVTICAICVLLLGCRENYGCEVVCFTADVGQVCPLCTRELVVLYNILVVKQKSIDACSYAWNLCV